MVRSPDRQRRVLFLLLPGVHLLDLAGALQTFHEARELGADYRIQTVGATREIATAQGPVLGAIQELPATLPGDLVVVPGTCSERLDRLRDRVPIDWLRAAGEAGSTLCSVCTGAFPLGWAGLLDGRECTTHWRLIERLVREVPGGRVRDDRLFVKDGAVYTSAGVASGIDLALSIVEEDHGSRLAARVAREMVVYLRRSGNDEQTSVFLQFRTHVHPGIHRVQDWLLQHPEANPRLDELAAIAKLSPRHLTRRFTELTGISLKEYSHRLKVEVAANLLRDPRMTVEAVASRCGFEDPRQLRRLWHRHHDTSPATWRKRQLTATRRSPSR